MQQKNEADRREAISMEEYLTKRKENQKKEKGGKKRKMSSAAPVWMLAELYI